MIKGPLLQHTWIFISTLGVIFFLAKLVMIRSFKVDRFLPGIFFYSLKNPNRHMIETASNRSTKRYLRISNKVNTMFYTIGIGMVFVYIFFEYIVQ